jgi:hypothetical protein
MTTTVDYLAISKNLAKYQKLEASKATVKTATEYYKANIGKVKTVGDLVGNYRLLSYALQSFGLGDQINNKALIRKVLEQGTTSSRALANTLPNANWKKFAAAFNFAATGDAKPSSTASVATVTGDYTEQQLEADQGESNVGVQLALYFKRVAPSLKDPLQILADRNLLEVVQTIFNLPAAANAGEIDKQAKMIGKLAPIKDFQDPKKLETLVKRFTANYDANYGPGGAKESTPLTVVSGNKKTAVSPATSILAGVVSNNAQNFGGMDFSSTLLSLAGLKLGG